VIRTSAAALFAVVLGGCAPSEPPLPPGTAKPVVAPTTVAAAAAPSAAPYTRELMTPLQRKLEEQRRATLPKPVEEVRPEGEPKSPEELQKLSDAAAAGTPVAKPGAPPIERIDDFRIRVGKVLVDREARRLDVPAKLNMTEGILEYYAVGSNGKLHESVIEIDAEPSHIHLGLILLGVEQIKYDFGDYRGPPKVVNPGGRLALFVRYTDPKTKKEKRHPAEDWLYTRSTKAAPKPLEWAFTGSNFWNNRYGADMDRSTIALIPDQIAVIGTVGDSGNPYRGDGLGFEVFKQVVPAKGTPLTLEIVVRGDGKVPPP
jgi:hypothetical protein